MTALPRRLGNLTFMMSTSLLSRSDFWLPLRFATPLLGRGLLASATMIAVGAFVVWRHAEKRNNLWWCPSHDAGLRLTMGIPAGAREPSSDGRLPSLANKVQRLSSSAQPIASVSHMGHDHATIAPVYK